MRRSLSVLSALALAASGLALSGTAVAAPGDAAESRGRSTTAAERAATHAYWTAERRAAAVPRERVVDAGPDRTPTARPSGKTSGTSVSGATYTKSDWASKRTGKVFFSIGSGNYVCSGSVVESAHDNLVLTAGHCAYDKEGGGYVRNFLFVPGYDGRSVTKNPYGTWAATNLQTTDKYEATEDLQYDVAFVRVAPPANTDPALDTLGEVVGEQAVTFSGATGAAVHALGYPAGAPYDGTTLTYCSGTVTPDPYGWTTQGLVCNMTGGSSGGPWYSNFDAATGIGTAYSLNSYRYTAGKHSNKMFGPRFGSEAKAVYDAMQVAG